MNQTHSLNNVLKHYKNINHLIEDALECETYDGNFSFVKDLHELIAQLNIPFKFTSSKKHNSLIEWLHDTIENYTDHLLEERICYEKTLNIVQCFKKWKY